MRKFIMAVFAMALIALSFVLVTPAANAGTDKIRICHATGNGKYIPIEISKDGTANGHAGLDHQNGEDIIPAYSWIEDKVRYYYEGQNLDKASYLDQNDCGSSVTTLYVTPIPPTYIPASCTRPELPYGQVVIPTDRGVGVTGVSAPRLNADNTVWSVSYTLAANTAETEFAWADEFTGTFNFDVVPITEDDLWVVDSKTGKGACTLPDMGAGDYILPVGGALVLMTLGAIALRANRRNA